MYVSSKNNYLETMGIQMWRTRSTLIHPERVEPELTQINFETFSLAQNEMPRATLMIECVDDPQGEVDKLLDAMLVAINLKRCAYLENSQPHLSLKIVMGTQLAQLLLNTTLTLEKLREENQERMKSGQRIFVTFHPNLLLADVNLKRKAWEDLKTLKEILNLG